MQRIPAFRVALKDRPKAFQYIVFFLVTFSLLNMVLNAVVLIQKEIKIDRHTNSYYSSQNPSPAGVIYSKSNVFSR